MKQIKNARYDCSLELAMELVGGKWKLVLLWQLLGGNQAVQRQATSWGTSPRRC